MGKRIKIVLMGSGGESGFFPLSEEQKEFWEDQEPELITDFVFNSDPSSRLEEHDIPEDMDFTNGNPWMEAPSTIFGITDLEEVTIYEVDDNEKEQEITFDDGDDRFVFELDVDSTQQKFFDLKNAPSSLVACYSHEEGNLLSFYIDLEDGEEFERENVELLSVEAWDIMEGDEYITGMTYNGVECEFEVGDYTITDSEAVIINFE